MRNWIAISIDLALLLGSMAQGQTTKDSYPSLPVRIIVPFAAGGPGDIFARLIGQKLSEQLGQQFFIENRPGASGNIGTAVAARAQADGYTLMVGSSAVWINASLYPQIPYDPMRDFEPIREGEKVGLACRANDVLTDIVKRVERGELKPNPRHITGLRLN